MPAAPDPPQLLITARVSVPRLCPQPWHRARSPPGAHGPPAPPASPLFCKPLCKTGAPTGTGWARGGHTAPGQPPPHPQTEGGTGARMGGPPFATFPFPLSFGVSRVAPTPWGLPQSCPYRAPRHSLGRRGQGAPSLQHQQVLGVSSLPRGCCSSSSSRARVGARGSPRSSSSSLRCACSTSSVSRVKDCGRGLG